MMPHTKIIDISDVAAIVNRDGTFPVLIVCEHASNFIPAEFDGLGLTGVELASHIAWDPGAAEVAFHLSHLLDAPLVQGKLSRLIYDCNRSPEAIDAIPDKSEMFEVPGNCNLTEAERKCRVEQIYNPFRRCVKQVISSFSLPPALITIHSFTPVYNGEVRAVELGILHDSDTALADAMLSAIPIFTSLETQRNEPYGPKHGVTHTLREHGIANGIPNVMIEIRNDLVSTPQDCVVMAEMLQGLITSSLSQIGHTVLLKKQQAS